MYRLITILLILTFYLIFQTCGENIDTFENRMLIQKTINDLKAGGENANYILKAARETLERVRRYDSVLTFKCYDDLLFYLEMLREPAISGLNYTWAHQMMDSFGAIESGVVQGDMYWLGDFYECLNVKVLNKSGSKRFLGQYCLAYMQLIPIKLGTCFPSSCTLKELNDIATKYLPFPFRTAFFPGYCQTWDGPKWDITSILIGCIYAFFIILVVFATIFDFCLEFRQKRVIVLTNKWCISEPDVVLIKGCWTSVLLSFSLRKNISKIMCVNSNSEESFGAVHGIRALSILWVVIGHSFLMVHSLIPWKNQLITIELIKKYSVQFVTSAEFAVDTFFCISGFLAAYGLFEHFAKGKKFNYPMYVIHRLWRLSPPYWLFLAFMCGPYPYFGKSPTFFATDGDRQICRQKWWQNVLFINVYFEQTTKCLPQAWYVCLDIVYYIILYPLIVIPIYWKPTIGYINFIIIFIASFAIPGLLIYSYELGAYPSQNISEKQRDDYMNIVYNKPWGRMGAALIGMIFGYLIHRKGRNVKLNLILVLVSWICAITVNLLLIYGMQPYEAGEKMLSRNMQMLYGTFSRPAWALTIGWIIYACVTGYGSLVNKILSWKGFLLISRLSYTIYIVHFSIIGIYFGGRVSSTYIDWGNLSYITISMILTSTLAALFLSLLSEAPFISLEKIVFASCTPKKKETAEKNRDQVRMKKNKKEYYLEVNQTEDAKNI